MKAQIIVTIGPATNNEKTIREMIENGMDLARLNFSWGTYEEHRLYIGLIRKLALELGGKTPIIQDLSGPRIEKGENHYFDATVDKILTKKDLADLDFAKEQDIDYVAQSYVGSGRDIMELRQEMAKRNFNKPIIAKIERKKALENLDEIIKASDALMIARGDLGNEIPLETIPYAQRTVIKKAKEAKKPMITATGIMLSMMNNPIPSRSDVSDATWAILDGSDYLMLSEETATGNYPVEVVSMMRKIVAEAERRQPEAVINLL